MILWGEIPQARREILKRALEQAARNEASAGGPAVVDALRLVGWVELIDNQLVGVDLCITAGCPPQELDQRLLNIIALAVQAIESQQRIRAAARSAGVDRRH